MLWLEGRRDGLVGAAVTVYQASFLQLHFPSRRLRNRSRHSGAWNFSLEKP